jgi:hypothetical protein
MMTSSVRLSRGRGLNCGCGWDFSVFGGMRNR